MHVRKARLGDLPAVNRIFATTFSHIEPSSRLYALSRERGMFVAVDDSQRVVGFSVLTTKDKGATLWVEFLSILPSKQRAGFGRFLMNHCEQFARQHSFARIRLRAKDAAARMFYVRLGYVATEGGTSGNVAMLKAISPARANTLGERNSLGRYSSLHLPFIIARSVVLILGEFQLCKSAELTPSATPAAYTSSN